MGKLGKLLSVVRECLSARSLIYGGHLSLWLFIATPIAGADTYVDAGIKRQLIDSILSYETPNENILDSIFSELGYAPRSSALWKSFPAIRQLAEVYSAAEAGSAGGGNRAIAAVADRMSKRFDSLRNNRTVAAYIGSQNVGSTIKFDTSRGATITAAPPEARGVIRTLSTYVERGSLGGTYGILTRTFSLDADKAYSILASSDSASEALMQGISEVPVDQQTQKLSALVAEATKAYPAVADSPGARAFRAALAIAPGGTTGGSKGVIIDNNKDLDLVDCLCGGRSIGIMPKSQCHVGMPCR